MRGDVHSGIRSTDAALGMWVRGRGAGARIFGDDTTLTQEGSRTEPEPVLTRAEGISCSSLISLGGAAMSRMRVCAAPNSAASSVAKPARPGKRSAYSASTRMRTAPEQQLLSHRM